MPQYRKLNTRTIESFDFNGLSDDFARLTWVLLPLVSCRDGRGIDIPSWLIGKLYPLRQDVTPNMIDVAMSEFEERGMVTRYSIDGRHYYEITNWTKYQGSNDRESPSPYPPQIQVTTSARPTHDQLAQELCLDVDVDVDVKVDVEGDVKHGATAPAHPPATSPHFQPVPDRVKKQRRKIDALLEPSPLPDMIAAAPLAMTMIQDITGHWPGENNRDSLVELLGDKPDETALRQAWKLWSLAGNKPTNFGGICEWYQEILRDPSWTPQKRFKNGSGKPEQPKSVSTPAPGSQPVRW